MTQIGATQPPLNSPSFYESLAQLLVVSQVNSIFPAFTLSLALFVAAVKVKFLDNVCTWIAFVS